MKSKGLFIDTKGNFKDIYDLKYKDLSIISELEEGYILEYKENFDKSVRKKIPAIFSSFANSEGGWLIIGVENDSKNLVKINKEKTDFDVTITNLLEQVTPKPKYDCIFLKENPKDSNGILVIYVYKGENTPYIANGTVYIRSGSSKVPITSDRATIDSLYKRNEELEKRKKNFTNEKLDTNYEGPILNIYMYNNNSNNISLLNSSVQRTDLQKIKNKIKKYFPECIIYPSTNGIIIKNVDIIDLNTSTIYIEIFNNSNIKINIPIPILNDTNKLSVISHISKINNRYKTECLDDYSYIEGNILWQSIRVIFTCIFKIINKKIVNFNDYEYLLEFENVADTILWISTIEFNEIIKQYGLPHLNRAEYRTNFLYIIEEIIDDSHIANKLFFQVVGEFWGFCSKELINSLVPSNCNHN